MGQIRIASLFGRLPNGIACILSEHSDFDGAAKGVPLDDVFFHEASSGMADLRGRLQQRNHEG